MMHIAFAHSMFNVLNAMVFTVFLNALVKTATVLTWGKEQEVTWAPMYLKESFLSDPIVAMEQVVNELVRMCELARETVRQAQDGFFGNNEELLRRAAENESRTDEFQRAITRYLIAISERHLDTRESAEYPVLLHSVNDIEKIGDYAVNIVNRAHTKIDNKLDPLQEGVAEIWQMFDRLYELFDIVIESLRKRDGQRAAGALAIEDEIDRFKAQVRMNHVQRLKENRGQPEAELMVMDLATNIEKMGDHLISVAKVVAKDLQWGKPSRFYGSSTGATLATEFDEDERESEQDPD